MCEENQTQVTQIRLLGFRSLHKYKTLLFIGLFLTHAFILVGNLLIIFLVTTFGHLKTPMFIFLKHLSITDILGTTSIVPMMLGIIFVEEAILPLWCCVMQLYIFGIFGFVPCFHIAVMSYDRYLAICHPLRYSSIMSPDLCLQLVIESWFLVFVLASSEFIFLIQFNFCGSNYVDHFFCDFGPIVELATSDTSIFMLQDFVICTLALLFPFTFIIMTYIFIFSSIIKISSTYGRRKAFSTCSSHLTTVCAHYGTLIIVYMAPSDKSTSNTNKYRSLLYTVVTPVMNPIIYSLRNHKLRRAVQKTMSYIFQNGSKK
ncbi:olfactory receptor 1-like [Bufo bufo]|uniref:olfactory receptor 1-like n=1 Tax=Bufo bufo TaxID=8384 RepID=UPI001ABE0771|nr:olfactory receptor 1-like [Bufo bufo]